MMENERGDLNINFAKIKRIMIECFDKIYANEWYDMKMDNLLERLKILKLRRNRKTWIGL